MCRLSLNNSITANKALAIGCHLLRMSEYRNDRAAYDRLKLFSGVFIR